MSKTVFSNNEISHVWAHQQQDNGRTSNNSMFFKADTIYSYGYHFPIARHYDSDNGSVILFTLRSYSNTTAKHISKVRSAIPHGTTLLYCAFPNNPQSEWGKEPPHDKNFAYWKSNIEDNGKKLVKARKKELYLNAINSEVAEMDIYATYFNLAVPTDIQDLIDSIQQDKYKDYLAAEAARIEADKIERERLQEIAKAEAAKKLKKYLKEWHAGKHPAWIGGTQGTTGFDYLRLYSGTDKDFKPYQLIETSQGLDFSVAVCKRLFAKIQAKLKNGGCDGNCGMTFTDSNYTVKEINKDFIIIGCHKIPMKEIGAIAKQLNWL